MWGKPFVSGTHALGFGVNDEILVFEPETPYKLTYYVIKTKIPAFDGLTGVIQIVDGEEKMWEFNLNLPMEGLHDLSVTIDQGQDRININHHVDVLYAPDESAPNPYQANDESDEEQSESE